MEPVHDLTAAYALDALDENERREYERHLSGCESCREELASFRETAGALALAVESPAPPPELRERILREARNGAKVVPLRSRRPFQLTAGLAAAAACLAIGLGLWATSLARSLDREREARAELAALIADPAARSVPIAEAGGRLVLGRDGRAALLVGRLRPAPRGRTYEIWVIADGKARPAGLFDASGGRDAAVLDRRVPGGAAVAVTLEAAGGADQPTTRPLFTAAT
jgi:anti-sigma-K factor RskA